jgi:hypothetical protein
LGSYRGIKDVLKLDSDEGFTTLNIFKKLTCTLFKKETFMVANYINKAVLY